MQLLSIPFLFFVYSLSPLQASRGNCAVTSRHFAYAVDMLSEEERGRQRDRHKMAVRGGLPVGDGCGADKVRCGVALQMLYEVFFRC